MSNPLGYLVAHGAYVPQLRLSRATIRDAMGWLERPATRAASGARAICNWDEDALTLAVEAARGCLNPGGSSETVGALTLASTTLPFADRSNSTVLAAALDLPQSTETLDVTGTLRAGLTALVQAAHRADGVQTLVVAADARLAKPGSSQELELGAAAAAFVVRPGNRTDLASPMAFGNSTQRQSPAVLADPAPPATPSPEPVPVLAEILAATRVSADFVDHYRMSGEDFDYTLEERWVRDEGFAKMVPAAINELLRDAQLRSKDVHHCVFPASAAAAKRIVQAANLTHARLQDNLRSECGDTGTAHPLLMLAAVLEVAAPGEHILLAGFGQGVEAVLLRVPPNRAVSSQRPLTNTLGRRREEPSYTRYLSHNGLLDVDFGMRAERDNRSAHSTAWRKHRQLHGFVGGRCESCGTVQFPKSLVCVNPECRQQNTQADFRLADAAGRVKTFTEDWQAYSPRPPNVYGNIEFEPGGNLLMEVTDINQGELKVGDRVRFVFRIKDVDRVRGFCRYFWKATRS